MSASRLVSCFATLFILTLNAPVHAEEEDGYEDDEEKRGFLRHQDDFETTKSRYISQYDRGNVATKRNKTKGKQKLLY